jgi:hypothetical protein
MAWSALGIERHCIYFQGLRQISQVSISAGRIACAHALEPAFPIASSQRFALTLYLSDETYTVDVGTWHVVKIAESCDVIGDGTVDR